MNEGRILFRYMAPLFVEESCLQCHADQGYKVGDVRGGISVWFDIDDVSRQLKANIITMVLLTISTTVLLVVLIYLFFRQLRIKLDEARALLDRMSKTDLLTEISNRRHLVERFQEELERLKRSGNDLCCIMLDVDHFKAINDTYGHVKGDDVLRALARILKDSVRPYDVLGSLRRRRVPDDSAPIPTWKTPRTWRKGSGISLKAISAASPGCPPARKSP